MSNTQDQFLTQIMAPGHSQGHTNSKAPDLSILWLASRSQTFFKEESGEESEAPSAKGQEGADVCLKPWVPHGWCASRLEERGTVHMGQRRPQSSGLYLKVDFKDSGSL